MLSAQYLVNCLDEDHVCHGITTQEPRPRPMKETLHSIHHSTVLHSLDASRKESLQNLHTHTVDSDIQLLSNKSTEGAPTPNSGRGAETEPEVRCTLSQLQIGQRQQPTSGGTVRSLDLQIVLISSLQTVSSTVFRTRVSLQRLGWLITQRCRTDPRTPRDLGNASCSQVMCTRTLALLPCSMCTRNVISRRVSYMCNRCSGWVNSKCAGLQNAAE